MDLNVALGTVAGLILVITALSEFVDKFWDLEGTASQVRSLAVGIIVGTAGAYLDLGMFADAVVVGPQPDYVSGPIIGLAAAVMANWSFTTPVIQYLLEMLKLRPPTTPPTA